MPEQELIATRKHRQEKSIQTGQIVAYHIPNQHVKLYMCSDLSTVSCLDLFSVRFCLLKRPFRGPNNSAL